MILAVGSFLLNFLLVSRMTYLNFRQMSSPTPSRFSHLRRIRDLEAQLEIEREKFQVAEIKLEKLLAQNRNSQDAHPTNV